jgi:hypothetical protein
MTTVPDDIQWGNEIFIITEGEHMGRKIVIYQQQKFSWGIETLFNFCGQDPSRRYFVFPPSRKPGRVINLKFQKLSKK